LFFTPTFYAVYDASAEVTVDELRFEFLERSTHSERLANNVDTVAVFIDHLLHPRQVTFDVTEAFDGVVLGFRLRSIMLRVVVVFVFVYQCLFHPDGRFL
jgi:hypothetical protein